MIYGLTDSISLTTNMPTGLFLSILKPFIIPLGFIAIVITCHLTTSKNCMRGLCLCRQLSWQNFSFYFVLNLDTGPHIARNLPVFLIGCDKNSFIASRLFVSESSVFRSLLSPKGSI